MKDNKQEFKKKNTPSPSPAFPWPAMRCCYRTLRQGSTTLVASSSPWDSMSPLACPSHGYPTTVHDTASVRPQPECSLRVAMQPGSWLRSSISRRRAHATSKVTPMAGVGAIIYAILWYELNRLNKQRSEGKQNWKLEGKTEEEIAEMGDES
jgi:hypothetical protein